MLNQIHLVDFNANRQYLLEKTQHMIGGFGKLPGDPPGKYPFLLKKPPCLLGNFQSTPLPDLASLKHPEI